MRGPKGGLHVILQERDRLLLSALDSFRIVNRSQAAALMGIRSISRINARLLQLTRAGFLARDFIPSVSFGRQAIYRRHGTKSFATSAVPHQLALNNFELAVRTHGGASVHRFQRFNEPITKAISLVPDAYFELAVGDAIHPVFVEVDLGTEPRKIWREKARAYVELARSGEFEHAFSRPQFRIAVVAQTARRLNSIREAVRHETSRLFFFCIIDSINSGGVLAPIWLRPEGTETHPLV